MKKYVYISLLALLITGVPIFSSCSNNSDGNEDNVDSMLPDNAAEVISKSKSDLAQRLNVTLDEITVHSLTEVEWNDTSMGYPELGMAYAQVITPGYLIVFSVDNSLYRYHSDREQTTVFGGSTDTEELSSYKTDTSLQDGWPSQPVTWGEVIIESPRK